MRLVLDDSLCVWDTAAEPGDTPLCGLRQKWAYTLNLMFAQRVMQVETSFI